ncbi:hypothetical protein [Vibrio agarivorans]|uniref:Uncharacterized protein n=1 Tax=Vibrio agarivorans TaxID=153622 RepID=A0ABT7Y6Y6_9VIBR|nr:hypothetical protein [Vibrio agarivorans]MDN2483823.1 hypothetical protein [Vibrio agarivorans]
MFEYGIESKDVDVKKLTNLGLAESKLIDLQREIANNINNGFETVVAITGGQVFTYKLNSGINANWWFVEAVKHSTQLFLAKEDGAQAFRATFNVLSKRRANKLLGVIELPQDEFHLVGLLAGLKKENKGNGHYDKLKAHSVDFDKWVLRFEAEGNIAALNYVKGVLEKKGWMF